MVFQSEGDRARRAQLNLSCVPDGVTHGHFRFCFALAAVGFQGSVKDKQRGMASSVYIGRRLIHLNLIGKTVHLT